MRARHVALWLPLVLAACGDDDGAVADGGTGDAGAPALCTPPRAPEPGTCAVEASDYRPGADDAWPACISDDGFYRRIEPTISTVARVEAFERIAAVLFDAARDASPEAFLSARMIYQEDEGLDSRVVRRYDPHFAAPDGTDCTMPDDAAAFPEYCVGPARLSPLVLGALADGIAGVEPRQNAARVEAGLLWFLYVSTFKESLTCTTTPKDCDSSYAYYTGGGEARCGIGLSRYLQEIDPYAHDRAWDGLLAVRCWRDLDSADVATDLALRDRARAQYDRAVLHGVCGIVRDRLVRLGSATGGEQLYHHAFVVTLGPVLDRQMRELDAAAADAFAAELAEADPAAVDVVAATAALDAVFACP